MQLLICVLNKVNCLEDILLELSNQNIQGATVLESKGMAHILSESGEFRLMDTLFRLLDPENTESKTFFMVIRDEQIKTISDVINEKTGGLGRPDTGILFTVPVGYTEGFGKGNCACIA